MFYKSIQNKNEIPKLSCCIALLIHRECLCVRVIQANGPNRPVRTLARRFQGVSGSPGALQAVGTHIYSGRDSLVQRIEIRFQRSFKYTPISKRRRSACEVWTQRRTSSLYQ